MLIHFSPTHLIFNCLWIYILGKEIESFDGKWLFLILILITSASSNYAQYAFSGPSIFGGLSGVEYGLLGICFVQETFTGFLDLLGFGKIANFAHLGGLISGIICGYLFQMYNSRKNYE